MTKKIHSCPELMDYIDKIGFLPLLKMGIDGWSADAVLDEDCQYVELPEGGWEWPLWEWKGDIIREIGCAYGKFIFQKATFISRKWWPDFCNFRRSIHPRPEEGSIEEAILEVLSQNGSMITRDLRKACGFTGPKMRSKFDGFITRLQMGGWIITEDFVYPHDKHGRRYGWGSALLTTPENIFGRDACQADCTPEESYQRLVEHFRRILPQYTDVAYDYLLRRYS